MFGQARNKQYCGRRERSRQGPMGATTAWPASRIVSLEVEIRRESHVFCYAQGVTDCPWNPGSEAPSRRLRRS